jgi:serine/threonine protein kinase/DNA-binding winged helix-turn-helix (wHTH) protein
MEGVSVEASTPFHRIRFGKFEVDPESGELFKDGRRVRLQGQPIQILLMLLEKPGRLVTREELQHRVWPIDTFVDFDYGLNAAIQRLRESLGDSADEPRYIETLPRRGYRFIFPVEGMPVDTHLPVMAPSPSWILRLWSSMTQSAASLPRAEENVPAAVHSEAPAVQVTPEVHPPEPGEAAESQPGEMHHRVDDQLQNESPPAPAEGMGVRKQSLVPGQRLGPYEVIELLATGGMGEVYRARDIRLERVVALKILSAELTGDPERLKWFHREARAASALNHPHIAAVHDIGEAEGLHFLVMEYVEGQTLAERIGKGQVETAEALDIGIQICEALEAAHQKGVIHRDIKPANVMVTAEGWVKVLDFGLAKQVRTREVNRGTVSLSTPGLVMGTVEYMSPEQALGQEVDHRTDLFSLGVVLYNLAAGRLPFQGTTPTETIDQILHGEPEPLTRFNEKLPPELERIIRKCLEKDSEIRYQSATDLRVDLKHLRRDTESGRDATAAAVAKPSNKSVKIDKTVRKWKWILTGLVLILLISIGMTWFAKRRFQQPPGPPELRETRLTANPTEYGVSLGCISPDGKYLAYSDRRGLYLKLIETEEVRTIPQPEGLTAENTAWMAAYWFPDGTRFLAAQVDATGIFSAWIISVLVGPPRLLRDNADPGPPSPDGSQIVYLTGARAGAEASELWLMGAQGENPRKVLTAPEGEWLSWPVWSPDGQRIAYRRYHGKNEVSIESCNLKGEQLTTILSDPSFNVFPGAWWFPNGRMIFTTTEAGSYQNDRVLWEIQVDPKTGRPLSPPRRITKWAGIYVSVLNGTTDGKRLAILRSSQQADVFVGEVEAGGHRLKNPRRLTLDEHDDFPDAWTRDSKAVFFHSDRNGQFDIFKQALDQETAEPVVTGPGTKHDAVLSPDGSLTLYLQEVAGGYTRIMRVPISGRAPEMVLEGKGINDMRCSWFPATLCVLGEESPDRKQYIFSAFDPMKGRGKELTRVNFKQPVSGYFWDLARDGSRLAFAQNVQGSQKRIQILPLSGGEAGEVVIQREIQLTSLDWAIDGRGFFVGKGTLGGVLLFVDMGGHTDVLWKRETLWGLGLRGLPSPDGLHLAMLGWTEDSNVWMLENF